jgi:putative membrane-bound dehydrogenase-like protein
MNHRILMALSVCLGLAIWQSAETSEAPQNKQQQIPHGQSTVPGPALSPKEALAKMVVPRGFRVELVAAEPMLVNPIAMCFDEKGRIWITESIEYPRSKPGPGKDRVKVLESSKGDGHYDKMSIVIEGLNIPSGIAVGHGGVWVANAPDILFYPFVDPTQRDLKLGAPEVIVSGFGRYDTHELPNSLTWGPDGWLYGLNGVFNPAVIKHRGAEYRFTCAMFRIHPRTKDFELFCEGTSNPWGIAFDGEGSAFVSACVIDHLWHLVQTGYYQRQGGPYPPFTWRMDSIVKHRHQKAAYCGICWFDSDAYPAEYREKLYMGNIHGNCINADELTRSGSTYFARPRPDFLSANDAWFMPVAQKVGPDGFLYVLDWYDRYHCYQDAQRDPGGIDRLTGRLYRVRYGEVPLAGEIDLGAEGAERLIERLGHANVYFRETAQRILGERLAKGGDDGRSIEDKLAALVVDGKSARKARLHALWALIGAGPLPAKLYSDLASNADPTFRAWAVSAAAAARKLDEAALNRLLALTRDESPDVLLQWAIAANRIEAVDAASILLQILQRPQSDRTIQQIVWQNLHPLLEAHADKLLDAVAAPNRSGNLTSLLPRAVERMLAAPKVEPAFFAALMKVLLDSNEAESARKIMATLADKARTGEISAGRLPGFRAAFKSILHPLLDMQEGTPLHREATTLAASVKDATAFGAARQYFLRSQAPDSTRIRALEALIFGGDEGLPELVGGVLLDAKSSTRAFRAQVVSALGSTDGAWVPKLLLAAYPTLEPEVQVRVIDLMTQRPTWTKDLLREIGAKKIAASALNLGQVRKLQAGRDKDVASMVVKYWGVVRDQRNPEREVVVAQMRKLLAEKRGDSVAGKAVFTKQCAVCHKIYGDGQEVGPDLTSNGRSDYEQLLSNVFDPNLVIGSGYQATVVTTAAGQIFQGLLVEDNEQRVVLKLQGGDVRTIGRVEIDSVRQSTISLMPEQLEKQMTSQELRDLFAFLTLDRPPGDPQAKLIPGTPR